jgi:hypothetical protein
VTTRHLALVISSVAVLAMGLYLFKEVRATPATADVPKQDRRPAPPPDERPEQEPEKQPEKVAATRTVAQRPVREAAPEKASPPPEAPQLSGDPVADELSKPNPKLDAVMAEANKAYDHGEFDDAKSIALKVLAKDPSNVRMLRIAVSSACIDGDSTEAQKHFLSLPNSDREQMKVRCARYGITFNDK